MKNFLKTIAFLLVISLSSCASTKSQDYHFLSTKEQKQSTEISNGKIKKEIKKIDKQYSLNSVQKTIPIIVEGSMVFVELEAFINLNNKLEKIEVKFTGPISKVKETYYFNNDNLIGYKIEEYKFNVLVHKEVGYINNRDLTLSINGKRSNPDEITKEKIRVRIKEGIQSYIKVIIS